MVQRPSVQCVDRLVGQERQADRRGARLADLDAHEALGGRGAGDVGFGLGIGEGVVDRIGCGVADPVRHAAGNHGIADVAEAGGGGVPHSSTSSFFTVSRLPILRMPTNAENPAAFGRALPLSQL